VKQNFQIIIGFKSASRSYSAILQKMDMQQIIERLLAEQEEMVARLEEKMDANEAEMKAEQATMEANRREMLAGM
jgi:hypothetical protein